MIWQCIHNPVVLAAVSSIISTHKNKSIKQQLNKGHDGSGRNLVPAYRNVPEALKTIVTSEGYKGLFKGIGISLIAQSIGKSLFFGLFFFNNSYEPLKLRNKQFYSEGQAVMISSFEAGSISCFLSQPFYIIKTRLLLHAKQYLNKFRIDKQESLLRKQIEFLYKDHGILGFYRGFFISMLLNVQQILNLSCYEYFQRTLPKFVGDQWVSQLPFYSGVLAKAISITILYPLTTIKVRIQENQYIALRNQKFEKYQDEKYKNIRDLLKKLIHQEGISGLYKGYRINIYRQVPQQGIFFLIYESLKQKTLNIE